MFKYNDIDMKLVERNDLDFLLDLRSKVWKNLGTINMINSHNQEKWFINISDDNSKNYYIVKYNNVRIGIIRMDEIDFINRSVRIGCDVHPSFQNKGYGTKIMKMIIEYCFNYLNMNRLWLMVLEDNILAKKVYEKVGFQEEGRHRKGIYRNGKYIDYILMGLIKE